MKGARWRVGNGESIGVWSDAWLPSDDHPRILSPTVDGFEEARVADLIDLNSRQWDIDLLHGLFNPHEVSLVKNIPICSGDIEDKLIWPFTPSGQYSVQLGYRVLAKENSINPLLKT